MKIAVSVFSRFLLENKKQIRNHFADIKSYANIIESRLDDDYCTLESVIEDNRQVLELAIGHGVNYILIDDEYKIDIDLER